METINESTKCKSCGSNRIVKYGTYNGTQMYFCYACRRKFKADDSLFHMKVPAEWVITAMSEYYRGLSIEDICTKLKENYGHEPSKATVYEWIGKYTNSAIEHFRNGRPKLSGVVIADETMLDTDLGKLWLFSAIDPNTKYLIATRVTSTRTIEDANALMEKVESVMGKTPKVVITDKLAAYLDGVFMTYGLDAEHLQGGPFSKEANTSIIERWHSTLKERTKVMKGFRDIDTLIQFIDGFVVFYNYFRPHETLKGKRPAEAAGIDYSVKSWGELCRLPVSKVNELGSHNIEIGKGYRYKRPDKRIPWRQRRNVEGYIQKKPERKPTISLMATRKRK